MLKLYKDYFNINPKYYAAVTADLIEQGKVSWKEFYPHETFIKLLETTYKVLSGSATRSIWVEGAYGTGKSHAALTVKSMIDASDEEVREYFQDFGLNNDLCDKLISVKNSGKILTIHRIGSANIHTDTDLILAVQQSVMSALKINGIENEGDASMRDAFLSWLEKTGSRVYFDTLIRSEKYAWDFTGMKVDDVVDRLKNGTDSQIEVMMRNVMKVLKENGQYGLFSDVNDMADWIKSIIEKNSISAILFVWDEFSEYFLNHPVGLTGFQTLIEISQSHPFYFMIVAHESRNLFADHDTANKTLGRFEPSVKIELPENMAFQLMAQAMKTTDDPVLSQEWEQEDKPALNDGLAGVRSIIVNTVKKQSAFGKKTQLSDKELQGIVPIHPYAALLLKHIATVFNSNQRSMFDFIISNDMTDAKGFKWFINNYGAGSDINLLTIDLLWDFFCGKEKNGMNDDVRGVLDSYGMLQSDKLLPEEQRVLRTILLLQAISLRVTGNELLVPNDQNVDLAFAGTDWQKGKAIAIANGLIAKNLLFKKPVAGGKLEYCVVNAGGGESIAPYRKKVVDETKTQVLIINGKLAEAVQIPPAIKQRFITEDNATGNANFSVVVSKAIQKVAPERFKVILTFAMTDTEMKQIRQQILKSVNMPGNALIFIESLVPMGQDLYEQYIDSMAFSRYNLQKNKDQANHYEQQAMGVLSDWRNKIASGAFMLYDAEHRGGQRMANLPDLQEALSAVNHSKYYYGLEQYALNTTLYGLYQLASGAGFGIEQKLSGAYDNKSNKKMRFDYILNGAWKIERYWEDPAKQSMTIVHIKKKVEELVQAGFASSAGRVSMMSILEELEKEPYGFMPSSVSAFILGFVLKEYATSDFFWSNGSNNETMTVDKMKTMIANALNQKVNASDRYKDEYIVAMTPSIRSFLTCTSTAFRIDAEQCGSVESARDHLRIKMKGFSFPVWCVKYLLKNEPVHSPDDIIVKIIDDYMGIANTANSDKKTENDLAERIGDTVLQYPDVVKDLTYLFTSDQCRKGMLAYIAVYRDGLLPDLASKIGDGGNYLERVKERFNAKDANWVWNASTADEKISDIILEYQIIFESNKTLGSYTSLKEVVNAWNSRSNNIKIPCEAAAKLTGDLGPFLWQLCYMKQSNGISEQSRQTFYDLLHTQRENFDKFYKEQVPYFIQDASAFLGELHAEEIAELYNSFSQGQFTKNKTDYYRYVQSEVEKYLQSQWKKKLRDLWYTKTQTKNPVAWSEKYETPILCMFSDAERSAARSIFQCIMAANPTEADVKKAIDYLNKADFYERLTDEAIRDQCFVERIISRYSVLLEDIALVRRELLENMHDRVYDWMDNSAVQNFLRKMADKQYKLTGCDRAMQLIDKMDAEQLRTYLRDRILDDTDFGMQILKDE
ncbi:MAG: hypothetical protein K2N87_01230 [Eubacterium sp.]|nr:hypothetical protein [Eubacterium sp.]